MARNNTSNKQGNDRPAPANKVEDVLLWCFEQTVKGDYVRLSCKLPSKAGKDQQDKHGKGIRCSVMARISDPFDYSNGWVHVSGNLAASDWTDKQGQTHTDLTVWASKVTK